MPSNRPPSDRLFDRVAGLRAGGSTWEAVAAAVGRPASTLMKWPTRYPDRWRAALFRAERVVAREAGAEAVLVLRTLLRSDRETVRRAAAAGLIHVWLGLTRIDLQAGHLEVPPPPLPSRAYRVVQYLEGQSDDELASLVDAVLAAHALDPSDHTRRILR